jgi:uroporphyrinogen-III synthase
MRRLFVFRPDCGASRTVERAHRLGLSVTAVPLFTVEPVEWSAPDPHDFDGILLTSANALKMGGTQLEHLRGLPVHTVGETTAVAAEVEGFGVASRGKGGVDDLLGGLAAGMRLLHLCGEDRRTPEAPRQEISAVTVYKTRPLTPASLEELSGQVAAVHSRRAAERLAQLVDERQRATIRVAAISEAAARAVGPGWEQIEVAALPNDSALLALGARLCET